jgi:hypothetical protein
MRRFAAIGAGMALLFSGAIVLAAASPSASPASSPKPSASPRASAAPAASAAPTPAASAAPSSGTTASGATSFSATVRPLQIGGSAKVTEAKSGTGTVTLRVTGLLDAQRWTVDIDGGTIALPNERVEIAFKTGADVTRLTVDTVRIHLTKTEMAAFVKAQKAGGVVAIVSDGLRVGYAEFAGS